MECRYGLERHSKDKEARKKGLLVSLFLYFDILTPMRENTQHSGRYNDLWPGDTGFNPGRNAKFL